MDSFPLTVFDEAKESIKFCPFCGKEFEHHQDSDTKGCLVHGVIELKGLGKGVGKTSVFFQMNMNRGSFGWTV